MHRTLRIPEILQGIFSNFLPDLDHWREMDNNGNRDLFNVSITCRSFTSPALDCLWLMATNLRPLFKLLSNFSESEGPEVCGFCYIFLGLIFKTVWQYHWTHSRR